MFRAAPLAIALGGTLLCGAVQSAPPAQDAQPRRGWELRQMPPAATRTVEVRDIVAKEAGVSAACADALADLCGADGTAPVRVAVGTPSPDGSNEPQPALFALAWPQQVAGRRTLLMGPVVARAPSHVPDDARGGGRWCLAADGPKQNPPIPSFAGTASALNPMPEEVVVCHLRARELLTACLEKDGTPKHDLDESARAQLLAQALKCHSACVMPAADPLVLCARFENLDAVRAAMLVLDERTDAELLRLDMLHMATYCGANALMERVVALADEAQPVKRPMTAEDGWPTLAWAFVDACDRFRQVQASNAKLMERAAGECALALGYAGTDAATIRRGFAAIVPYLPLGRALPGSTTQRAVEIARDRCYSDNPTAALADRLAYTVAWVIYGNAWSMQGAMLPSELAYRKRSHALIMDEVRNGIDALMTKVPADFKAEAHATAAESERQLNTQLADPWRPESVFNPDPKRLREVRSRIRKLLSGEDREQQWQLDPRADTTYRIEAVRWHIDSELGGEWSLERPTRLMPFRGVSANYENGMSLSSGQLYLDLSDTGEGP
jgi:hypothetical protein